MADGGRRGARTAGDDRSPLAPALTLSLTRWPPAKKVKPYDPSTVPTYRPLKGQGNDHQPPVKEGDEKPPAWKPGMGEQAIFSS